MCNGALDEPWAKIEVGVLLRSRSAGLMSGSHSLVLAASMESRPASRAHHWTLKLGIEASWYWGSISSPVWLWMEHIFAQGGGDPSSNSCLTHALCLSGLKRGKSELALLLAECPSKQELLVGLETILSDKQRYLPSALLPLPSFSFHPRFTFPSPLYFFPPLNFCVEQRAVALISFYYSSARPLLFVVLSLLHWTIHVPCHRIPVCLSFTFADDPIYLRSFYLLDLPRVSGIQTTCCQVRAAPLPKNVPCPQSVCTGPVTGMAHARTH